MSINLIASMVAGKKEIVNILDPGENESRVLFLRAEFNLESVEDFIKVAERMFLMDCPLVEFTTNERTRETVRVSAFALETRTSLLVVLGTTLRSFLVEQLSLRMRTPILCSLVSQLLITTSGADMMRLSRRSRMVVSLRRSRAWESANKAVTTG